MNLLRQSCNENCNLKLNGELMEVTCPFCFFCCFFFKVSLFLAFFFFLNLFLAFGLIPSVAIQSIITYLFHLFFILHFNQLLLFVVIPTHTPFFKDIIYLFYHHIYFSAEVNIFCVHCLFFFYFLYCLSS